MRISDDNIITEHNDWDTSTKVAFERVLPEKDDLETQFREVKEKADRASSQLSALQQELERTRQHANEALKAMDVERQQLQCANNRLRDNIEELHSSLVPKENALETLQQSLLEKEQMLEDMRWLLQAADEKRQSSIAELSLKHQKQVEVIQAQIADALNDRSKATETILALRALVAERDSKIAEMDAASSGEVARHRAALETLKGELSHLKNEQEKERESWEAASHSMRMKLETAESTRDRAEVEVAKMRMLLDLTRALPNTVYFLPNSTLEKDDLETQFREVNEKADCASSQLSALQ
ncbi:Protein GRIP [Abeliophyllum distichum]|uniref:Protein GRIP n=1 Tax=Abeliophyllum distichum TaxID=126358 RepID=A0ABD1VVT0_9LAMI